MTNTVRFHNAGKFIFVLGFMHSEARNQFVNVGPVRYAYRKLGKLRGVPLILLIHIRGNMDSWDPALIDGVATRTTSLCAIRSDQGEWLRPTDTKD